ncbi:restriction endonuclease subunit S [Enterococcus gallinarum]|uniref:Restriction endonuclease subunit S n=1 Tax=Enterococcus gallinarum TaxID=1353 RepID=A0ABD4HJD1_ENTGA|nr:restriction endonuclease subunit S [Enterococcus gallinarum]MBA0947267.1 restriction endonuclease subunit S [Enterococcus gallinarum]MBA0960421.1 restriction endonuclease subunit S [Enterococcus gallinarum]MBA0968362.1 restriction endonuclease subunit S [Enterococcus gallinarum]MBA0971592.1 restriction endonuclease subunit S [Enterococcus gallinarum]MCR1930275.1 restriction endonuclease subunit S [Enterococcus gallinarum]
MTKKNKPGIRFPGFTEEWEQRKLGEYAEILTGGTPKTSISEYWEPKKIPWMSSGEVNKRRLDGTDNMISEEGLNNSSARWVKKHSVLIALAGQGKTRGTVAVNNIELTTNQSIAAIVPNNDLHYEFIYQNLIKRYDELRMISSGDGTRGGLNKQIVSDIIIPSPIKNEQMEIGTFFKQLDDTIALHQRELELLKETKKGFLQKMFPKEGEKVPEIRFPGFTEEWEQRKLGEVIRFLNGKAYKQQELLDSGKYRVLRVGNFNTNDRWYYSDLELEENKYANKGDLLYLWATSFGPEIWNEETVIYHYHIWKLEFLTNELDKQYLYTWLLTDKEKIKQTTNGTTMVHVTKGIMEQRLFQFPQDVKEQQKIGTFFKQLDDTIALHQRELDLLKETKKGFLQKLFV